MVLLPRPWLRLPGRETLLIQVQFNTSTYSIRVTDLQRVWSEDLSHAEIQERARSLECPIDASVDMASLLRNLEDSLTVDSGTTVTRHLDRTPHEVVLSITQRIGVSELAWTFHLAEAGAEAMAELALSLFSMVNWYQAGTSDLFRLMQEKDRVIRQMSELCKGANITYKPPRSRKAAFAFDKADWCTRQRAQYQPDRTTLDVLRRVGENATTEGLKEDWPSVLQDTTKWTFDVLTSDLPRHRPTTRVKSTSRVKQVVRSKSRQDDLGPNPSPMEQPVSPVIRSLQSAPAATSPPVPLYKLKDNRESQELEEDLTLSDATTEDSNVDFEHLGKPASCHSTPSKRSTQSGKPLRNTEPGTRSAINKGSDKGKDAYHNGGCGNPALDDGNAKDDDKSETETEDEEDEALDAPFLPSSPSTKSTLAFTTSHHRKDTDKDGTGASGTGDESNRHDDDRDDDAPIESTQGDTKSTESPVEPETPRRSRVLNLISPRKKREGLQASVNTSGGGSGKDNGNDDGRGSSASARSGSRGSGSGSGDLTAKGIVKSHNGTVKSGDRALAETDVVMDEEEERRIKILQKRRELERKIASVPPKKARRF